MRTRIPLALLATALACSVFAAPAHALRARVFVSKTGADVGACSFSAPCQSLNYAFAAVETSGEITILDSGGYNPITITKGVTITVPPGVEAGITAPAGGAAITINAQPIDKIVLRGLTLDGQGIGTDGIDFNSGASLTVEDCVVRNFTGIGLYFISTATSDKNLVISNSSFSDNGGDGVGIVTESTGGIYASIDRTSLHDNALFGLLVWGFSGQAIIDVSVTDSVATNNGGAAAGGGISVVTVGSNTAVSRVFLTRTAVVSNLDGISADGNISVFYLAQSTVSLNKRYGYVLANGALGASYGDNYVANPGNSGSLTTFMRQ